MRVSLPLQWGTPVPTERTSLLPVRPAQRRSARSQGWPSPYSQPVREYRIAREDVVEVSVWKEPDLSRTLPVRPDGKITLPLVGDLDAAGKTPAELESAVQQKLSGLVRDPRVTVLVRDINGSRVYVTGMVAHPGAFALRSSMDVLQALAMAGGLAEFADRGEIAILHADGTRHVVDYDDLVNGKVRRKLSSGDTVVVP
ncbi:MAG: sugar ABC transporter substrate-binding protein [Deltaproteobacteria bacterium]|nr:MAG: sugar ABC transporter substrate-binding protein [Deltaproteobacteria bacterium]